MIEAIDVAKKLIRHEVERGDDIGYLRRGQQGCSGGYWAAHIKGDKIFVTRIKKKEINEIFPLSKIFNMIKRESVQPTLF